MLCVALLAACLSAPRDSGEAAGDSRVSEAPPRHSGPVILITLSNLRADAASFLGGPAGTTPHLDALAARADFAGSAVAASSSPPASAASLLLGVDPWQHQLLSHKSAELRPELPSLGAVLGTLDTGGAGYRSSIHYPMASGLHRTGLFAGFDHATDLDLDRVVEQLRTLESSELVWIHLPTTELPWTETDARGQIRDRLEIGDLYLYADPELPLPLDLRARARRLYVAAVRRADAQIGRLLDAMEQSGRREEALVAVTAFHGIELGEHGQALYAQNLGRSTIQVPLLIDLPAAWSGTMPAAVAEDPVDRPPVSLTRLWPTLVQVVGGEALPVHRPGLFDADPLPPLSSLYLANGVNLHSAIFAGRAGELTEQVLIESRFAPAEAEFYLAQLAMASLPSPGLAESPRRLVERLRRPFLNALPWSTSDGGVATVSWSLERWTRVRGTETVDDPEAAARRAAQAHAAWSRWVGPEETPEQTRR